MTADNVLGFIATIDVTDLKAGLRQVNKAINQTKNEFDTAAAGLENWQKSSVGVNAKLTQLNGQFEAQKKAVEAYKNEIERVKNLEGDHSKQLEILQTKLQKAQNAVSKTQAQIDKYSKSYETLKKKEDEENSANTKLVKSIDENREKLKDLENQYKSTVIAKGQFSKEARELGEQVKKTSTELKKQEKQVKDLDQAYKYLTLDSNTFSKLGKTLLKSVGAISGAISGAVLAIDKYTEAGADYNKAQNTLEITFRKSSVSVDSAKRAYSELFTVLGDTSKVSNTLSYFAKFATTEKQLNDLTNILTGAYAEFGDTISTDELAKNISELVQTGDVTGQLSDVLKQTGINLDSFKDKIAKCKDNNERLNATIAILNSSLGSSATQWKQENSAIISQNQTLEDQLKSKAEINEKVVELKQSIQDFISQALAKLTPYIKEALDYLNKNWRRLTTVGVTVAGIGTALIGLNGAIKTYENVTKLAKTAQLAWNAALSGNPIGMVLTAVASLGVAVSKVYSWYKKTNEEMAKSEAETASKMYEDMGISLDYVIDRQSKAISLQRELNLGNGEKTFTFERVVRGGGIALPEGEDLEKWLSEQVNLIQKAEPEVQEKIKAVFDFEKALKTIQTEKSVSEQLEKINNEYASNLESWNNEYVVEKVRLEKTGDQQGLENLKQTNQERINEISKSSKEEAEVLKSSYIGSLDTIDEANQEILDKLQNIIDNCDKNITEETQQSSITWQQSVEQTMQKVSTVANDIGGKISSAFSSITSTLNDYWQVEIDNLDNEYDAYVKNLEEKQKAFEEEQEAEIAAVEARYEEESELREEALENELKENEKAYEEGLIDDKQYFLNKYAIAEKYNTKAEKDEQAKDQAIQNSNLATTDYAKQLEEEKLAKEKEILAQKNELGEKQFKAQKANDIAQVWIKAALAIVSAYAESFWLGVAASVALPILAGVQTAAIAKQQYTPITALATGGVIDEPTYALVGEAGKEAVMPLENNTGWIKELADQLNTLMKKDFGMEQMLATPQGAVYYNGDTINNYNYDQTINSPKSLTRAEIYRDSKSLLSLKKY